MTGTLRGRLAIVCSALFALAAPAFARDIAPRGGSVVCSPGGVAAIPLVRAAGDRWPARLPVSIGGLQTQASVVWIGARPDDALRSWTRSPEQLTAKAIESITDGSKPEDSGEVMALVELPASGEGKLEILGHTLETSWLPFPPRVRPDAAILPVTAAAAEDRPDATTPNEYWRWSLLAASQSMRVSEPRGTAVEGLWARHVEGLWRGGLERVRRVSRGVHDELVEALTAVVHDPVFDRAVAAWLARPDDLHSLLSILIDADRSDQDTAQAALSWMRAHWMLTMWTEADAGDRVRIAVANPTSGERVARFAWIGASTDSVASAISVPPRSIGRIWVDRPPLAPSTEAVNPDRTRQEGLEVSDGALRTKLGVGGREYPVRPPGLSFGTFLPVLSLADAQSGSIAPPSADRRTTASLRRRQGHWELFIECLRPEATPNADADEVVVRFGDPVSPTRTVRVRASGALLVEDGPDDGASAGFMTWRDRWRARLEIPEAWIPSGAGGAQPLLLSVERLPGAPQPRQTAGLAMPPWKPAPPAVMVDLSAWNGIGR